MNREFFEREIRQAYLDGYDAGWAEHAAFVDDWDDDLAYKRFLEDAANFTSSPTTQATDYACQAADSNFGPDLSTIDKAEEHFGLYATVSRIGDETLVVITPDASEASRSVYKELDEHLPHRCEFDTSEVGGFIVRVVDFRP